MTTDAERVQTAFDAAVAGDVEPLVALFAPGLEWRGRRAESPVVAFGAELTRSRGDS